MIHQVKKSLTDFGDKVGADEKAAIEAALKEAEEVVKSDDKEVIDAKSEALMKASHSLAEKMYAAQQGEAQAAGAAGPAGGKAADDNVMDAEFTEVKDEKH
jgi:molecular chaperone DnaK